MHFLKQGCLALVFMLLPGCLMKPNTTTPSILVLPQSLIQLQGLSVKVPNGNNWYKGIHNQQRLDLSKKTPAGKYHTIIAFVETGYRPEKNITSEELKSRIEDEFSQRYERFTPVSKTFRILEVQGIPAVRVDFTVEDHEVKYAPGKTFILTGTDLYFTHPHASGTNSGSLLIKIAFSQRYLQGEKPVELEQEMLPFLTGFALTQISAAEQKGAWVTRLDSQGQELWSQSFPGFINITSLQKTDQGEYMALASSRKLFGWPAEGWQIVLTQQGKLLKLQKFASLDGGSKYAGFDNYGGTFLYGDWLPKPSNGLSYQLFVKYIESSGQQQWLKSYGGPTVERADTGIVDGNDLLLAASSWSYGDNGGCWLVKIDTRGTVKWTNVHDTPGMDHCRSLIRYDTDNYLMTIDSFIPGEMKQTRVMKLNNQGLDLWHSDIFNLSMGIVGADSKGLFFAGMYVPKDLSRGLFSSWATKLVSFTSVGKQKWTVDLRHMMTKSLAVTEDGGCLLGGQMYSQDTSGARKKEASVVNISADGETSWRYIFPGKADDNTTAILSLERAGFWLGEACLS